jgi:hypothetical protein
MSILLVTFILGGFFIFFGNPWEHESGKELFDPTSSRKETCHE